MHARRPIVLALGLMLMLVGLSPLPASADTPSGSGFSARGIPLQGQVLLGAASGNSAQDPLPREATVGGKFGLHRTYWRGDQQVSAMDRARVDLANGRLPWLSFKAPYAPGTSTPLSWAEMVAGAGDAWARDLAARLGTLPGPVWVAVHHEPEGDGDEQEWKRMQQRLAPIFRAQPNIAFTIILMGYHQWMAPTIDPRVSMDALFPGTQYVDVVGFDPYCWYGTKKSDGSMITTFTELKAYYTKIAAWAASVGGVKWAVAETGYTDLAADKDVAWLSRAYDDMRTAGGIALTYWDNQGFADAVNTFRLSTTAKQAEFAQALARSNRLTDTTTPPTPPTEPPLPPTPPTEPPLPPTPPTEPPPAPAPPTGPSGQPVATEVASAVQQYEPPAAAVQETVHLKAQARSGKRILRVRVWPSVGKRNWTFQVERLVNGAWVAHETHSTTGRSEVKRVNLGRGTYRVIVLDGHGFLGAISEPVWLRR